MHRMWRRLHVLGRRLREWLADGIAVLRLLAFLLELVFGTFEYWIRPDDEDD